MKLTPRKLLLLLALYCLLAVIGPAAEKMQLRDPYLQIDAAAGDPLYTTYAAAMERSRLYGDKAYKMDYYSGCLPLNYSSDQSGRIFTYWKVNQVVIESLADYHEKPRVKASFPDLAVTEYQPFPGLAVQETFLVYSSGLAVVGLHLKNLAQTVQDVEIYPVLELGDEALEIAGFDAESSAYLALHDESLYRLISSLSEKHPYPTRIRNVFAADFDLYSHGAYQGSFGAFYNIVKTDFYARDRNDRLNLERQGRASYLALHGKFSLQPGEEKTLKFFRGWQDHEEDPRTLLAQINSLKNTSLQAFVAANEKLFAGIPRPDFPTEAEKLVYLGAFNLARGCMLPPSGQTSYNFYVFSREPLWGWGHGHQVLHESLTMLAYAWLDPRSAQDSQRVYLEQQRRDGLIAYRHGPRGLQDYPHFSKYLNREMSTTSAPFFSWINWEIFRISGDRRFLAEAYAGGSRYADWLIKNRDLDRDGLFEWGPYGLIENVRDWYNAVFQVSPERHLSVDKEDISDDLECLDLSLMMVKEMRSLSAMAEALGKRREARKWREKADKTAALINRYMWDEEKQFYFSVNRDDHSFMYLTRDLRREEIIGFLPLWAGAATPERAEILAAKLLDPDKFWRRYGVPTLAADDEWYSPYVDYCCKWNGPVWLLWNYLVIDGLRIYGYHGIADELADKLMLAVSTQLSKNHNFWESYSPDNDVLNAPSNYIWDAIMARILIERYRSE